MDRILLLIFVKMRWLREYFQLDKRQERGLLVLIVIVIFVIAFNRYAPKMFERSEKSLAETRILIEKLPVASSEKELFQTNGKEKPKEIILEINRFFNPNTISLEKLKETKLPAFVAENWVKYRNSGAVFYKAEDVAKVYGINDQLFDQLKPWIYIPKKELNIVQTGEEAKIIDKALDKETNPPVKPAVVLGVNSADSLTLLEVNGIGPFYAGALVRYRERLGGYRKLSQLMELYKMDSSKLERMLPQLYLDSIKIDKINLNTAAFKEILRHPYIDYETTKYIVNKRNKLGKFAALYQLKDTAEMPDTLYYKLLPYIKLED